MAEKLWGNNYGPVTAIRFGAGVTGREISGELSGSIDPYKSGFTITDLPAAITEAAAKSVDFSTLFLSLGFFIILSAIMLLILVISTFFESKRQQVSTLFSLGFSNRRIGILLFAETGLIALAGALAGAFAGSLFNTLIIGALNSVWQGAVQTNTIDAGFFPSTILTGFATCFILILVILKIKSVRFLRQLNATGKGTRPKPSVRYFRTIAIILVILTLLLAGLSFIMPDNSTILSFASGISAFSAMILIIRHIYIRNSGSKGQGILTSKQISGRYYSFNPSQAVAPVLFLAAGLFAVIITGMNRMNITDSMLMRSGGTGGFLLWGESPIPVSGDLNNSQTRHDYGIDDSPLSELFFVQAAKTSGNDASCLNLNHITSPPLIGIEGSVFAERGSFSFASVMKGYGNSNPWMSLDNPPNDSTIYGIADQTVLQYGLQLKTGDTIKIRAENGQVLNVIISAGLKSSVFQGYVITGKNDLHRFFPSISGSQIFLADGNPEMTGDYIATLNERLSEYGVHFEPSSDRLASFFVVTNTYLTVFTILGGIGMILGVGGLGFMLVKNFNQRRREFGLMMAAGFSLRSIRMMLFRDHSGILLAGIITGIVSALLATRPSVSNNAEMPWTLLLTMAGLILVSGITAITLSLRSIRKEELISRIRKE
jgi:ABC-type antimicrobial peptide transport system permease subunit